MGLSLFGRVREFGRIGAAEAAGKSVNDVKRTNGQLRLEQKLRTQEPFDEWPD